MNLRRIPWSDALFLVLPVGVAWAVAKPGPWSVAGLVAMAVASCVAVPARFRWAWAVWLGGIALYALNPTHRWVEGTGLIPAKPLPGLPGSAFPRGTWNALGMAAAACSAFVLASALSTRKVRILQAVAAVAGAGLAVMVLAQRLEPKPFPVFERTAIFVYENHFAAWANLILPVTLALGTRCRFQAVQQGRMSSPAGLCYLAALLLAGAIVMSRSRAGVAVMAFGVVAYVVNLRLLSARYPLAGPPRTRVRQVGTMALCFVAAILAGGVIAREWNGFAGLREEGTFRFAILKDAFAGWRSQPVWGTGPGTFSVAFPYFQSEFPVGRTLLHAHCEPVQFLVEFGLAGGFAALAAAGLAAFGLPGRQPEPDQPSFTELERRAFGLGLLACALHAIIDFPLRTPWIGMIAASWAGIWVGSRIPRAAGASPAVGKGSLP